MTPSIKLDIDVGDLVSHAGQASSALDKITEAMKKVDVNKDPVTYAKLAYEKDRMQTRAAGYDRDLRMFANNPKFMGTGANGQPVFKIDQKYADLLTKQIDVMKKLTNSYSAAIDRGDVDSAMALSPQITKQQNEFHETVEKANGLGEIKSKEADAVKAIGMNQLVNSLDAGLKLWVSSIDRTAIINQLESGDVVGAHLSEKQRKANLWSGGVESVGSFAGMAGMMSGNPIAMGAGLGVSAISKIISNIVQADTKEAANKAAWTGLWEGQKDQAMNLAALHGTPNEVRESWKEAAGIGKKYGYSAEESAELIKQALAQGVGKNAVDQVFQYERATGADRGALASLATISARYGGGDVLQAAWRGLNASGMKEGQLNEILRGMQRVMEDGISKGFVRSSDQVARNLTMLSQMTNENPLWTGEHGLQRLSKINSGLESTVGLQSSSDLVAFRAARRVLGKDAGYEDVLALQERGISDTKHGTQFMKEVMNIAKENENGDRSGIVEILRDVFKLNYNEAITFHDSWKQNNEIINDVRLNEIIKKKSKPLPEASPGEIPELKASIETMNVRNLTIEAGQGFWDDEIGKALKEMYKEYQNATGKLMSGAGNTDVPDLAKTIGIPDATSIYQATDYIKSHSNTVIPRYFTGRNEENERNKFGIMLDRASSESELQAGYNLMQILSRLPNDTKKRWDRENTLNPIVNESGTLQEMLNALKLLIEIEQRNGDLHIDIDIDD